jgi:hypothetical protein
MSLKEQKEKLIEEECDGCYNKYNRECAGCPIDHLLDRLATSEEKVKQLSELSNSLVDVENILTNRIRELENEIKKLSEALKGYYEHSKNNHQINGLNETAKELLNNKEI